MMRHVGEKGVALITALIFTALVTTFAVAIASRQQLDIRRTGNIFSHDASYLFALGIEDWARDVLKKDLEDLTGPPIDHLGEDWNVALPPIAVESATLSGKITDLQGLININGLVNSIGQPDELEIKRFQRLLELFDFNPDLVDAVVDWIDPDTETKLPAGAEDSQYLSKEPAYRAANAPMVSISELRLVEGFEQEVYDTLKPFLTALPATTNAFAGPGNAPGTEDEQDNSGEAEAAEDNNVEEVADTNNNNNQAATSGGTPINVNTAPLEVLRVLTDPPLSASDAESLIESREEEGGFEDIQAGFLAHPVMAGVNFNESQAGNNGLALVSEYFLIEGRAVLPDAQMQLFSVVQRDIDGNLTVLMRGQGSY